MRVSNNHSKLEVEDSQNFCHFESLEQKFRLTTLQKENDLDEVYGYNEPSEPGKYTGWLVNMHTGDTLRIVFDKNTLFLYHQFNDIIFSNTF